MNYYLPISARNVDLTECHAAILIWFLENRSHISKYETCMCMSFSIFQLILEGGTNYNIPFCVLYSSHVGKMSKVAPTLMQSLALL